MGEILIPILQYLTASLTPPELLAVLAIIGILTAILVRFGLKKRKAISAFFAKEEDETLKEISGRIALTSTTADIDAMIAKLEISIKHQTEEITRSIHALKEKLVEISTLRNEIDEKEFERTFSELDDLRDFLTKSNEITMEQRHVLLQSTAKLQEIQARTLSQVEKVDEYLKAAVPEFRGYHRELGSDVKMLGRDIALIERSIELSINTSNAVKLR
jgi:hypothetical protein